MLRILLTWLASLLCSKLHHRYDDSGADNNGDGNEYIDNNDDSVICKKKSFQFDDDCQLKIMSDLNATHKYHYKKFKFYHFLFQEICPSSSFRGIKHLKNNSARRKTLLLKSTKLHCSFTAVQLSTTTSQQDNSVIVGLSLMRLG